MSNSPKTPPPFVPDRPPPIPPKKRVTIDERTVRWITPRRLFADEQPTAPIAPATGQPRRWVAPGVLSADVTPSTPVGQIYGPPTTPPPTPRPTRSGRSRICRRSDDDNDDDDKIDCNNDHDDQNNDPMDGNDVDDHDYDYDDDPMDDNDDADDEDYDVDDDDDTDHHPRRRPRKISVGPGTEMDVTEYSHALMLTGLDVKRSTRKFRQIRQFLETTDQRFVHRLGRPITKKPSGRTINASVMFKSKITTK